MNKPKTRAERQAELGRQIREGATVTEATHVSLDVPAQPESSEPTATGQLQALRELRHRRNGPIVPRPAALTLASVRAWLRQVADIGSPGDVEIAWYAIDDAPMKHRLMNEYEQIKATAGRRYTALVNAAQAEKERERSEWQRRAAASNLVKEIQRDQARLAEKRRRLVEAG